MRKTIKPIGRPTSDGILGRTWHSFRSRYRSIGRKFTRFLAVTAHSAFIVAPGVPGISKSADEFGGFLSLPFPSSLSLTWGTDIARESQMYEKGRMEIFMTPGNLPRKINALQCNFQISAQPWSPSTVYVMQRGSLIMRLSKPRSLERRVQCCIKVIKIQVAELRNLNAYDLICYNAK